MPARAVDELLSEARKAYDRRDLAAATKILEGILSVRHDCAAAHELQGVVYFDQQRWEEAGDAFNLALHFDPSLAESDYHLALLAIRAGDVAHARRTLEKLAGQKPQHAPARVELGKLLLREGDPTGAEKLFREAIAVDPKNIHALSNLGYVLLKARDLPHEALAFIDQAIRIAPDFADALCNRGMVLQYLGRCEEALAANDRALELAPGMLEARLNRSLALLMLGRFELGWREYEVRKHLYAGFRRAIPGADWEGQDLCGKTLLVYAEQGLGDEIMFASCVPDVMRVAGHVVIDCHKKLEGIFARSFPGATVVGADQTTGEVSGLASAPSPDYRVALGTLPMHFRKSAASFPSSHGYLRADPGRVASWRCRLDGLGGGRKIGLSWRGGSSKKAYRSIDLRALVPLLSVSDSHFISLQYTDCADEIRNLQDREGLQLHHWQDAIDDYDETAALVSALDAVISIDTAIAHLTGALGKVGYILISAVPEWRFQSVGERTQWYPSVKLFRQTVLGDWSEAVCRIRDELGQSTTL